MPRSGSTRTRPRRAEADRVDELRALLDHPKAVAVGEAGLDYHYGADAKDEQRSLFAAQLALAAELGLPIVVHTRSANADTEAMLRAPRRHRRHALLLRAGPARGRRSSAAGTSPSPATRPIRRPRRSARRPRRVPADRILAETDSPYLAPQPVRGRPNEPAYVVHTLAALAEARGEDADELAAPHRRQRNRRLPAAVSVRPKKQLGQHFLVDENILGVIGGSPSSTRTTSCSRSVPASACSRAASPTAPVTSTRSSSTARSRRTSPTLAARPNVDLHWGDALELDLAALEPAPTKLVANLPYNVATPIVAESLDGLPTRRALVRDGAAGGRRPLLRDARRRRRTAPSRCSSSSRPSAPASIRSRARCSGRRRTSTRRSSPSAACRCRTTSRGSSAVVEAAFAHRRKTLPNSIALAGLALARRRRPPRSRRSAARRRRAPRRSRRAEFVALTEAL